MAEELTLEALKKQAEEAGHPEADVAGRPVEKKETPTESNLEGVKEVSIADMAPARKIISDTDGKPSETDILGTALYDMDAAVERTKKDLYENLIEPKLAEAEAAKTEAMLDNEFDGENVTKENANKFASDALKEDEDDDTTEGGSSASFDDEEVDFEKLLGIEEEEEETDDNDDEEEKKAVEDLKVQIKENLTPIKKSLDLSKFTISKKPISVSKILAKPADTTIKTADWILLNSKKAFSMSELSGAEIEKFNPNRRGRNAFNILKEIYSIMYNHLIDDNKPATLEAWLKTIAFSDNRHLFFGAYKATFQDTNILPYSCPECKHAFMQTVDIDEMVKYPNDDVKKTVEDIRRGDTTSIGSYEAQLVQISDKYAVAIKVPTVYSVIIESAVLDESFTEKYNDLLAIISYIDDIYLIDEENQELRKIDYRPIANDFEKSTKRKVAAYAKVLNQLTSDQTQALLMELKKLDNDENDIIYRMPEAVCPKCASKIAEQIYDPQNLLFTRHQLVAFSRM